jgi:serine/threonine-protein kinase
MQWQPGYKLKKRPYEIEKVLGEGGFGIAYKAKHLNFDIPVVIKTLNSKRQRSPNYLKFVESFKREGKQLAKIGLNRHPHIVRVSDFFDEDDLSCIVMDFIEGKNLEYLTLTEGKLAEATALKYIKQIASALTTCHNAGIIHRDVSPLNIIISNQTGNAILIDFGISMSIETSRHTYSANQRFAPWEQRIAGENNKTPQIDIYALAATLYFLVTGQDPIPCLARKYESEKLIEPRQLNSNLSKVVNDAISKGMELLPESRRN